MKKQNLKMIGLLYVTYLVFYLPRKADSVVKSSLQRELGFTLDQLGYSDGLYLLVYTFALMASGILSSRYPSRVVLPAALCGMAAVSILKTYAWSPESFMALQVLHAMVQSTGWPTCVRLLSVWIEGNRGLVMGVWTTCQSVGGILGAVAATYFTSTGSWTWAYYYHVPLLLGWAALLSVSIQDRPAAVSFVPDVEAGTTSPAAAKTLAAKIAAESGAVSASGGSSGPVKLSQIIALKGVPLVAAAYFFLKFLRYALLMWLPYYYEDGLRFETSVAGYMSTSFEVGGMIGTPFIGWVSDRAFRGRRDLTSALFMGCAAVMLAACRVVSTWGEMVNALCMVAIGVLVIGPDSVLSGTIAQDIGAKNRLSPEAVGSVAGFINSIGSGGSVLQSSATAYISRVYGWGVLFAIFVVASACSSAILFYVTGIDEVRKVADAWFSKRQQHSICACAALVGTFVTYSWFSLIY